MKGDEGVMSGFIGRQSCLRTERKEAIKKEGAVMQDTQGTTAGRKSQKEVGQDPRSIAIHLGI